MNKLFTSIAVASLSLTMAVGVGVAVGTSAKEPEKVEAAVQSVEFDLTSSGTSLRTTISTSLIKYESGSVYASIVKGTGTDVNNYCPGGKTDSSGHTRVYNNNSIQFGVGSGYVITKVDITATGSSNFGGVDNASNYTPTATMSTSGSVATASFATAVQAQTAKVNTTATGRLTKIKIYYDQPSAAASMSVDKTDVKVAVGYDATFTVTTLNLSSSFSVTGGDTDYFTTSYTPSSADGNHVVTLHGVASTSSNIELTISATGVDSLKVNVSVEEPQFYEKVIAASSIKSGSQIVIGTTDGTVSMAKYLSGNNCPAATTVPTQDGKLISTYIPENVAILTVGGSSGAWTLTDSDSKIYYGVSGENQLKANTTATDTWSIAITSAGVATITSAASSRSIKKNSSSALFNTYASGQTDISIYMVPSSSPELEVVINGKTSLGVGETADLEAVKVGGASGTVGWATSNSSILSISAATGDEITVTAGSTLGSATITASLSGCEDVEIAFTVRKGSATVPYSVAEAITAIDGTDAEAKTSIYVQGIISQVDALNSDNSITYWISDNGTTTTQMEVYKGFGLNSATFSSVDDLQVGDHVVVTGDIKKYTPSQGDPIYEFNAANHLYSFERPTNVLASITSIEGTLNAVAGDPAWNLSGLTVKGTMEGSSDVVDVTMYVDLSTSDVPGTPTETVTRDVSITATGKVDSTITHTNNVSGTVTAYSGLVSNGQYRIKATRDSTTYYLQQNGTAGAPKVVTNFYDATIFTFTKVGNNTYTITNGDNYLYVSGNSNNGVRFGSTEDTWLITNGTLESGAYDLKDVNNNRYLTLYAATDADPSDWRCYTTPDATNRKENTDLQAFTAAQYASEFMGTYTNTCDPTGTTPVDTSTLMWDYASSQFAELSTADQNTLKTAIGSNTGSDIEKTASRYDTIIAKYGSATINDFMGRGAASQGLAFNNLFAGLNSESTIAVIIVVALTSVTAIGAIFFIKRRKYN